MKVPRPFRTRVEQSDVLTLCQLSSVLDFDSDFDVGSKYIDLVDYYRCYGFDSEFDFVGSDGWSCFGFVGRLASNFGSGFYSPRPSSCLDFAPACCQNFPS